MAYNTIVYEKSEGIGTITLNRPKSMNALSSEVFCEVAEVLDMISADPDVRVVILTGSEKFFAAGADITEIRNISNATEAHAFLKKARAVFNGLEDLEKPVIAAVSGFALGGGCELILACDIRICSENAVFGQPEIKIGVIPGGGGTQRLPRTIGVTKAKELLYTGDTMNAAEALVKNPKTSCRTRSCIQNILNTLDSGVRRNDESGTSRFYGIVNYHFGAIRMAPSRRITSPLSIGFSIM